MLSFEQAFSSAKHKIYSHPNKIALLRNHINYIAEYIYSVYLAHPEKSLDEVIDFIYDDFETSSKVPFINPYIQYSSMRYEACKYLINNPQKIDELLDTIKKKGLTDTRTNKDDPFSVPEGFLSGDFEQSLLYFVLYEKSDFDECLSNFTENEINFVRENFDVFKKNLGSIPYVTRMFLEKAAPLVMGSYSQRLRSYISQNEPRYEKNLRESLADSISSLAQTLDKYGLLQSSRNSYNVQMEELGFPELSIPEESSKNNPNLSTLLSFDYLSGLSLEQLLLLNHFYINRISKEFEKIKDGLFVIDDLDLYDVVVDNNGKNIGYLIDDDTIYDELLKMQLLYFAANDYYSSVSSNLPDLANDSDSNSKAKYSSIISNARKLWNRKYSEAFYPDVDLETSKKYLSSDLAFYLSLHDPIYSSYVYKNHSSTAIMAHLLHSKKFRNWGYVPEFSRSGKNTIETGNKFILIGVDCEGLNRPVFTHELSSKLRDFFQTYTGKPIIPIYEGIEDFTAPKNVILNHPSAYSDSSALKNNIIVPVPQKQKKIIKNIRRTPAGVNKFFSHIDFLRCHANYPDHLKIAVFDKETGRSFLEIPNRFVNLSTGRFYKEIDGKLVELENIKGDSIRDDSEK